LGYFVRKSIKIILSSIGAIYFVLLVSNLKKYITINSEVIKEDFRFLMNSAIKFIKNRVLNNMNFIL
jgi:uncharacterized membrane protein (Fun14 family)